jgi:hypothetical protein
MEMAGTRMGTGKMHRKVWWETVRIEITWKT